MRFLVFGLFVVAASSMPFDDGTTFLQISPGSVLRQEEHKQVAMVQETTKNWSSTFEVEDGACRDANGNYGSYLEYSGANKATCENKCSLLGNKCDAYDYNAGASWCGVWGAKDLSDADSGEGFNFFDGGSGLPVTQGSVSQGQNNKCHFHVVTPITPRSMKPPMCNMESCQTICKQVSKVLVSNGYEIPYVEQQCEFDPDCTARNAECQQKLNQVMKDAEAAQKALIAATEAAEAANGDLVKEQVVADNAAKEVEASAQAMREAQDEIENAQSALASLMAELDAIQKQDAAAKVVLQQKISAKTEVEKKHLEAQAAYQGQQSVVAKAVQQFNSKEKTQCEYEKTLNNLRSLLGMDHLPVNACETD